MVLVAIDVDGAVAWPVAHVGADEVVVEHGFDRLPVAFVCGLEGAADEAPGAATRTRGVLSNSYWS